MIRRPRQPNLLDLLAFGQRDLRSSTTPIFRGERVEVEIAVIENRRNEPTAEPWAGYITRQDHDWSSTSFPDTDATLVVEEMHVLR